MNVILLLIEHRVDSVRYILCMRGLGLKRSVSRWSSDSESVRSKYLLLAKSWVNCDRQGRMAMTSAVKMEAMLRTRWAAVAPPIE